MNTVSLILQSAITAAGLAGLCGLVGLAFPDRWLLPRASPLVQRALLGFAVIIIVMTFPYRNQAPVYIGPIMVGALAIYGAAAAVWRQSAGMTPARSWPVSLFIREGAFWALATLPLLVLVYVPLLTHHALFFETRGPDLFGDLMTTGYLADGHQWADLMGAIHQVSGNYKWWDVGNQRWFLPNFREAVAIDFFPRAIRWGHAVVSILISRVTGEPIWIAFFSLTVFCAGLFPSVIVDAARSRGIKPLHAILLAIAITGAQTYVLMLDEGIVVQFIAMAMLLFLLFNVHHVMTETTSTGQKIVIALLLIGLTLTFGEGTQIVIIYATFLAVFVAFQSRFRRPALARMASAVLGIGGLFVVLNPVAASDFIWWSLLRLHEDFIGGALPFHWSILSIILSLPYAALAPRVGPHLISNDWLGRAIEAGVLVAMGVVVARRRQENGPQFLAAAATVALFVAINLLYPVWKISSIMQPLIIVGGVSVLPERLGSVRKGAALAVYAAFVLFGGGRLMAQYVHHALPIRPDQFVIDENAVKGQKLVLVTPSMSAVYLTLGASQPLYLLRGWHPGNIAPDFRIGGVDRRRIGIYYDCDAEGRRRCAIIRRKTGLPPRVVRPLDVRLSALEDRPGHISNAKLDAFIQNTFGVAPEGGQIHVDHPAKR